MSVYDDQDLCLECGAHFSDPHDPQCPNEKESKCECGGNLYPMDTEDHECKCGQTYCGECDAEYSREGEKLSGGVI